MEEEEGMRRSSEGCISHIISFTSPADACRLAAVSRIFRSAADSDAVWRRFLPPDFQEIIISRAHEPLEFSSMKELFFRLANSILLDGGRQSFSLEPWSGRKSIILSARELTIMWGDSEVNWRWTSGHGSRFDISLSLSIHLSLYPVGAIRFSEVAQLLDVCWLDVRGKIDGRMVSENTVYAVHLLFKIGEDSYGLDFPLRGKIRVGDFSFEKTVHLCPGEPHFPTITEQARAPRKRDDGWMESEVGRFFCVKRDGLQVEFSLTEIRGLHWKRGLLLEGIQVRPAT